MKRLLTFIYGLLMVYFGIDYAIINAEFFSIGQYWRLISLFLCLVMVWSGVEKLEKATS